MTTTLPAAWRRYFEYEVDAHRKVFASLEAVPAGKREAGGFRKAVELMAHVVSARLMWLHRFGAVEASPGGFFPKGETLEDVVARCGRMEEAWKRYLERLTEAELGRVFDYVATDGKPYRKRVEDILTQLFFHSGYHRGQVALLLRQLGEEPAVTDFVFWATVD